jgi:hypothetical protein
MAVVMLVIVAIPVRLGRPESGNETRAIGGLKLISAAEIAYSASCGNGGYATSLDVLLAPAGSSQERLLSVEAVTGTGGSAASYVFTLAFGLGSTAGPKDCMGRPTRTGYYATAVPRVFGRTGSHAFAMNTEGVVWRVSAASAPVEPFSAPATPIR